MKTRGEYRKMKKKKRVIETGEHITGLIDYLLPAHRFIDTEAGGLGVQEKHPAAILIKALWDEGQCRPIGIDRVGQIIAEQEGWKRDEKMPARQDLRERLQKRVQRIDAELALAACPFYAYIKYDRSTSKLQLILKPDEVQKSFRRAEERRRLRGMAKEIQIEIITREYARGVPVLRVGDIIKCRMAIPISGYPHLFHVDANEAADKMFPARGAKKETVRCGEQLEFPGDLLKEGYWWKVGKITGKKHRTQQVVAVVSRLDVKVAAEHLKGFGIKIRTRGALQEETRLEDINSGGIAFGSAAYEMRG